MKQLRLSFAIVLFAAALLTSCTKPAETAAAPEVVRDVRLVQSTARELPQTVDSVGTVRAAESATLSAQVMGTITAVFVREGDRVRAGQTLLAISGAQLDSETQRTRAASETAAQQVKAAESESNLAASTLQRYQMLKAQRSVSPHEFEEVEARAQAASARLAASRSQQSEALAAAAAARTLQGYTKLHAPFDGVVTARLVDPGAVAAPGVPLLTVEKAGPLRLEISIDESLLGSLRTGAKLPVAIDTAGSSSIEGTVAQIVPAADPASHSFLVKIALPPVAGLHSGTFGRARITRGTRQAVLAPSSALVTHGSMQGIYVVGADHIATLRYITAGEAHGAEVEVLSGLNAGETLIDSPGEREMGGKRIEVRP